MGVAEFLLLVVAAFCGLGAVSALVAVPLATGGLLVSSWPKYYALWGRASQTGKLGAVKLTLTLSLLNALVAVFAAFGLGMALRLWLAA